MTRREILLLMAAAGFAPAISHGAASLSSVNNSNWKKCPGNPVLGGEYGTCFDICVLQDKGKFRMWLSWRPKKSIAISDSSDGIHWSAPQIVLAPDLSSGWEEDVNRPVLVKRGDTFHMWYTGQTSNKGKAKNWKNDGRSTLGYATSTDGVHWSERVEVLKPEAPWEGVALMSPHVLWDEQENLWRMWYSGGEQYEPNAIGHATSVDGRHWTKDIANPIFRPDPLHPWEKERVAGAQVIQEGGWFYIFYIGYRDIDHAQIGVARSRNGIDKWERCPENPIVRAVGNGFDGDACYKPYALFTDGKWMLWYNGRNRHLEQIGLATRNGRDLGFPVISE